MVFLEFAMVLEISYLIVYYWANACFSTQRILVLPWQKLEENFEWSGKLCWSGRSKSQLRHVNFFLRNRIEEVDYPESSCSHTVNWIFANDLKVLSWNFRRIFIWFLSQNFFEKANNDLPPYTVMMFWLSSFYSPNIDFQSIRLKGIPNL